MQDLNVVSVTGTLLHEPEPRFTRNGEMCLNLRLLMRREGDRELTVTVTQFGDRAAHLADQQLRRGDRLWAHGEMRLRYYPRKTGSEGAYIEVIAERVSRI